MKKIFLGILLLVGSALSLFAEIDKAQLDLFNKESAAMRGAIDDITNALIGGGAAQRAKGTYLEGYGAVFTLEVSLEPTRSPFSSQKAPAEVRSAVEERRNTIQTKLESLLKQRVGTMQ